MEWICRHPGVYRGEICGGCGQSATEPVVMRVDEGYSPTPAERKDWLDVMRRIQEVRDEVMSKLNKIDEALNGLIASGNRDTQNPTEQSGSVDPHEREHPDTGETQLEFALRTESEVREAAWRARSTPTEPPHSYPHDIG